MKPQPYNKIIDNMVAAFIANPKLTDIAPGEHSRTLLSNPEFLTAITQHKLVWLLKKLSIKGAY